MAIKGADILKDAEQLLREGKKQEALALLVEYIQGDSSSARAWWMLSFAVSDPQKQIDCLERVLKIDPQNASASTRLEKLKGNSFAQSTVAELKPVPSATKKNSQFLYYAVLAIMVCAMAGLISLTTQLTERPAVRQSTAVSVPNSKVGPYTGYYAPDFVLMDVHSQTKARLSHQRGKPVLIYFWATWCTFCKAQMPSMEAIYKDYQDDNLVVLAVDVGESASQAREYSDTFDLTFPILDDSSSAVASRYEVTGYPTFYFIAPSGVISAIRIGGMEYGSFNTTIREFVELE